MNNYPKKIKTLLLSSLVKKNLNYLSKTVKLNRVDNSC